MYILDMPEEPGGEDLLERRPFAERIARTVADYSHASALIIGIYGVWGEGKTSLLSYMTGAIEKNNKTAPEGNRLTTITFNPWYYADDKAVIEGFFKSITDALFKAASSRGQKSGRKLKKLASMVATYGQAVSLSVGLPGGVSVDAGKTVAELARIYATSTLEESKDSIGKELLKRQLRLVILIDDIDRLDETEIQTVFKLVRLAADFPYVVYILAFDETRVAAALGKTFPGAGDEGGHAFIDKIVQVPLAIPKATRAGLGRVVDKYLDAVLDKAGVRLADGDLEEFRMRFQRCLRFGMLTPRHIIRYANALSFSLPLLEGEINVVDLMTIEAIRTIAPELHRLMRAHREIFVGYEWHDLRKDTEKDREYAKLKLTDTLERYGEPMRGGLVWLIEEMFPHAKQALAGTASADRSDLEAARQKRVWSTGYYDRYFFYGVPPEDLPDRSVDRLITVASSNDEEQAKELIRSFATLREGEPLVTKLEILIPSFAGGGLATIARSVAPHGSLFASASGLAHFFSPRTRLARLVGVILKDCLAAGQKDLPKEIATVAEPIHFGKDIVTSLPDGMPERGSIQSEMLQVLAGRIEELDRDSPLLASTDPASMLYLDIWAIEGNREALQVSLRRQLDGDRRLAARLVERVAPVYVGRDKNDLLHMPLRYEDYQRLGRFLDSAELATRLTELLPDLTAGTSDEDRRLAEVVHEFLSIYAAYAPAALDNNAI